MSRPPFEVADIVRRHGDRFLEMHRAWLTSHHRRVLRALVQCRTAALGGHRDRSGAGAGIGDIRGLGLVDIFVGNGNRGLNGILSYTLLNTGDGQFTRTSTNIPVGRGQLLDPYTGRGKPSIG